MLHPKQSLAHIKCVICGKEISMSEERACLLELMSSSGIEQNPICEDCFNKDDILFGIFNFSESNVAGHC